jgi:hypothetical protein
MADNTLKAIVAASLSALPGVVAFLVGSLAAEDPETALNATSLLGQLFAYDPTLDAASVGAPAAIKALMGSEASHQLQVASADCARLCASNRA